MEHLFGKEHAFDAELRIVGLIGERPVLVVPQQVGHVVLAFARQRGQRILVFPAGYERVGLGEDLRHLARTVIGDTLLHVLDHLGKAHVVQHVRGIAVDVEFRQRFVGQGIDDVETSPVGKARQHGGTAARMLSHAARLTASVHAKGLMSTVSFEESSCTAAPCVTNTTTVVRKVLNTFSIDI